MIRICPPVPHSGELSDFQSPSLVGDLGDVSERLLLTDSYLDLATPSLKPLYAKKFLTVYYRLICDRAGLQIV